ncbi:MAG: substrate binding domain-containing protein, partial [Proteobacteria bacterium]|nr:substrate binding domain-containing protein [Pseudomonadota bacterium]
HLVQLALDEEAQVIAAGMQDYPTGVIQITAPASMEPHLTVAAADFMARWPGVEFIFSYTDQLIDLVKEGLDMAVRIGRLADSSLKARKIGQTKRFICANPIYLQKFGTPERAEDLEDLCCLTFRASPGPNIWQFRRGEETVDIRAEGRFRANSGVALLHAARLGLGIILVPEWLAGPDIKKGNLVPILEKETLNPATTPIYVVHAYEKFVPPKVRVFGDFLAERFKGDYDWSKTP